MSLMTGKAVKGKLKRLPKKNNGANVAQLRFTKVIFVLNS